MAVSSFETCMTERLLLSTKISKYPALEVMSLQPAGHELACSIREASGQLYKRKGSDLQIFRRLDVATMQNNIAYLDFIDMSAGPVLGPCNLACHETRYT